MKQAKQLANAIKNISATGDQAQKGKVVSVDKTNATCEVEINELEFGEVRLQAIIKPNQKGIKVFPVQGSWVIVEKLGSKGDYYITMFSEVEQIVFEADNTKFDLKEGILLQRGNDSLKQILLDIIEGCEDILVLQGNNPDYVKLSNAKTAANNLLK